jgi:mono/diheme cytochrome c family protein
MDPNPRIRIQALRASETLYKEGNKVLEDDYQRLLTDANTDVLIQAILTAKFLKLPELESGIKNAMTLSKALGVKVISEQILAPPKPRNFGPPELSADLKAMVERGTTIYNELCSQCHGPTGMGTPAGDGKLMAPALAGSTRMQGHPEYAIKVVLHGMDGAIENKTYTGNMMASMKDQSDQWIADVISYIRSELSNDASFVSPEQVAKIRAKTAAQSIMFQFPVLQKQTPFELSAKDMKASASHTASTRIGGNASPQSAFNYEGWSTGIRQVKGMWYQVEFSQAVHLAELHFTASQNIKPGWRQTTPPSPPPFIQTYPRIYAVETSLDGKNWETSLSKVNGNLGNNVLSFNATQARFLRLKLEEGVAADGDDAPWSMRQMKVFVQN